MDKALVCLIAYLVLVSSYHLNHEDSFDYNDEYEKKLTYNETQYLAESTSVRGRSKYEVTEMIEDIPDNRTRGPIVTNYTIAVPLNTVTEANDKEDNKVYNKHKKNYFTLLHINAGHESSSEDGLHNISDDSKIEHYLNGVKEVLVNGFNDLIKRDHNSHKGDGPFGILRKIFKKGIDVADRVHKAIFGNDL